MQKQRILLVGGAGFIGHHLAIRLATDGAQVHIVDHLAQYHGSGIGLPHHGASVLEERQQLFQKHGVILHRLDASESRSLCNLLRQIDPEVVFHLAAVASSEHTDLQPALALRSSLQTLSNSLEHSTGVQRFIYFSSSMVYGNFVSGEADEN